MKQIIDVILDRLNFVWLGLLMAFAGPFAPAYVARVLDWYAVGRHFPTKKTTAKKVSKKK